MKLLQTALVLLSLTAPVLAQTETKPATPATPAKPSSGLASSDKAAKPLAKGVAMPDAKVRDIKGAELDLKGVLDGKPAVIVFYRGGWCPYCNKHLSELVGIEPELNERGITIIALSPDTPEHLAETVTKDKLTYKLFSDSEHKAMEAFGVGYTVEPALDEKLQGYGIDLSKWSGNRMKALPVPSVFVVDEEGKIRFAHSNPDYTVRLSGTEVLKATEGIGKPVP